MMSANAFAETKDPVMDPEELTRQKAKLTKAMPEF